MKPLICVLCLSLLAACSSSGPTRAGETTGNILRAPVDFFSGLGRGVTGRSHTPLREFQQNWNPEQSDPDFWLNDEQFFADLK
ncbi:MAG: hypothetical protein ACOX5R_12790 [bacterium]|jgi:hypothetical protein